MMMDQTEEDSKESPTKKMILEDISKNEIKRPSELKIMKKSKKYRNRAYKALPKMVEDQMLCRYEESETETYYWLPESDVDEIEEKLRKKVSSQGRGKIPSDNMEPEEWFQSKKGAKKREEKLLKMLNTRVKSLTTSDPTEKDEVEDLLPGNMRVVEIRNFIEKKDILSLAHKSEPLMKALETNYKEFREAGKMDIHGDSFPGCLFYFELWHRALDDKDSGLVEDEKRVNILLEILERRLNQLGLEYSESVRMGEGEFWDEESDSSHKEIEIIQSIIEKLEGEERAQEDKLKDLKARLNEIL